MSLRWLRLALVVSALICVPYGRVACDDEAKPSAQEQAVRDRMKALVEGYNQGDAKKVAALWSETAEYTAPDGVRLKGRDKIEKYYAKTLAANKGIKFESIDAKFRMVTPDVAIGEGSARTSRPGETAETSRFMSVHVLKNGEWFLDSVHETIVSTPTSPAEELKQLEWLVGDWSDAADDIAVEHKVEWVKNHTFLVDRFTVTAAGSVDMQGMQIIGWDPAGQFIRSWYFDTNGGFGEGRWTKSGDHWTVKSLGTFSDGRPATATHVYKQIDKDSYLFKSIGRKLGDELFPNIENVKIVRKPAAK